MKRSLCASRRKLPEKMKILEIGVMLLLMGRFLYKRRVATPFLSLMLIAAPLTALADSTDKFVVDPFEFAPDAKVECNASTLDIFDYKACAKRKLFFDGMSASKRKEYNELVQKRRNQRDGKTTPSATVGPLPAQVATRVPIQNFDLDRF